MTKIPLVLQKIKQLSKFASDTFFPNDIKCIVCDYELKYDNKYGLCDKCVLPHNSNFCKICGSNINGIVDICQFCKREEFDFEFARSPLVYQDAVKDLIRGYKFGHKAYLAPFFAQFLIKCYIENNLQVDFVTFVPIHISKLKTRGYNQSQLVAQNFVDFLKLELVDCFIKAVQHNDTARLNRKQRFELLKGVMHLKMDIIPYIENKSILIIDDVFTTGATVGQLSKILKSAGALKVYVLTIASGHAWIK